MVRLILNVLRYVNTLHMAAYTLVTCVARTSAGMILIMMDEWVIVFREKSFQPHPQLPQSNILKINDIGEP